MEWMKVSRVTGEMEQGFRRRSSHFQVTQGGEDKIGTCGTCRGGPGLRKARVVPGLTLVSSENKERGRGLGGFWKVLAEERKGFWKVDSEAEGTGGKGTGESDRVARG